MPTYLLEEYDMLATNEKFSKRVRMGFVHVAKEVMNEDAQTPHHILRASFARGIMMDDSLHQRTYIATISSDEAVINAAVAAWNATPAASRNADTAQTGVSNDLILAAIRSVWNIFSGVEQ